MDDTSYRNAERLLWADAGATPTEHRLHLDRNDVDVRVQEVGHGQPVLFVHGGPGAAGAQWAHLAARLPGLRCLLLDPPGTGLTAASPLADATAVRHESETLVPDVLDAMGIERAHLVGSSHGGYVALLAGELHPERVDRIALQRDTDTMANEFATISAMGTFHSGFDRSLSLEPGTLAAVRAPTHFLWGTQELYGDETVARRAAGAMPDAKVEMMAGVGHLCWIDDVDHAATVVLRHLLATERDVARSGR